MMTMGCNCSRNKLHVTSANLVATTAGEPTEGARTLARRRAEARVAAARTDVPPQPPTTSGEASA